jgi:hypothetical protein
MQWSLSRVSRAHGQNGGAGSVAVSTKRARPIHLIASLTISLFPFSAALSQTLLPVTEPSTSAEARLSPSAPFLSKFEARRIRHKCRDQIWAAPAGKDLRHCFEMHIAARRLWSECKKTQPEALHGRARDEAVQRCVMEKSASSKQSRP